jgi:hypothetical protein
MLSGITTKTHDQVKSKQIGGKDLIEGSPLLKKRPRRTIDDSSESDWSDSDKPKKTRRKIIHFYFFLFFIFYFFYYS